MAKRPGGSNTLRIIGGNHRGRKLAFPDVKGLRPTGDRMRETLFNWLQNDIAGSRCLDMYAGSGALGFEAASRGAAQVVMVEQNPRAVDQLKQNMQLLQLQSVISVAKASSPAWLKTSEQQFDIVFLDPPFANNLLQASIDALVDGPWLADQAHIYVERDVKQDMPGLPENWSMVRDKKQGQVAYCLIKVE